MSSTAGLHVAIYNDGGIYKHWSLFINGPTDANKQSSTSWVLLPTTASKWETRTPENRRRSLNRSTYAMCLLPKLALSNKRHKQRKSTMNTQAITVKTTFSSFWMIWRWRELSMARMRCTRRGRKQPKTNKRDLHRWLTCSTPSLETMLDHDYRDCLHAPALAAARSLLTLVNYGLSLSIGRTVKGQTSVFALNHLFDFSLPSSACRSLHLWDLLFAWERS